MNHVVEYVAIKRAFKVCWKDKIGTQRTTWFTSLVEANTFRRSLS